MKQEYCVNCGCELMKNIYLIHPLLTLIKVFEGVKYNDGTCRCRYCHNEYLINIHPIK